MEIIGNGWILSNEYTVKMTILHENNICEQCSKSHLKRNYKAKVNKWVVTDITRIKDYKECNNNVVCKNNAAMHNTGDKS